MRAQQEGPRSERSAAIVAGAAAQFAALIWTLQWSHALVAHGPTSVNLKRLWLGLTWIDSAKFLTLSFLLLIPGVMWVSRRVRDPSRALRGLRSLVLVTLVLAAAGTALQFGLYEWGSYAEPNHPLVDIGGITQAMSSLVLTLLIGVLATIVAMRNVMPWWLVPLLILGSLGTVFPGGPNFFFGIPMPPLPSLVWFVFGGWLLTQAGRGHPVLAAAGTTSNSPPAPATR